MNKEKNEEPVEELLKYSRWAVIFAFSILTQNLFLPLAPDASGSILFLTVKAGLYGGLLISMREVFVKSLIILVVTIRERPKT